MQLRSLLLAAIFAGAALPSHAALVTWGAATTITGDTDVSTNGTLVEAYNMGNASNPDTTVNGVTFSQFDITSPSSVTVGNVTMAGVNLAAGPTGSVLPPYSTLSLEYRNLLGDTAAAAGLNTTFTLTLANLTVGATYEFQWWMSSSSLTFNDRTTTATAGNSVAVNWNPSGVQGGVGQFAIGTFIADNASQVITFTGTPGNAAAIAGMQYRQLAAAPSPAVPEPGTALAGVLALGLLGTRRRCAV